MKKTSEIDRVGDPGFDAVFANYFPVGLFDRLLTAHDDVLYRMIFSARQFFDGLKYRTQDGSRD
jgi:hypothetical protein